MTVLGRATEAVFWVLARATLTPVVAGMWLVSKLMYSSDRFRSLTADFFRWRRAGS